MPGGCIPNDGDGWNSRAWDPSGPHLMCFFTWLFIYMFYNKPAIISSTPGSLSHYSNYWAWGRSAMGTPSMCPCWTEVWVPEDPMFALSTWDGKQSCTEFCTEYQNSVKLQDTQCLQRIRVSEVSWVEQVFLFYILEM